MNDQAIEQEIQAKGKIAARVTPDDIEANIVSEHYFTAADGFRFNWLTKDHASALDRDNVESIAQGIRIRTHSVTAFAIDSRAETPSVLGLLTFCVLVLRNGFTVTGESACASPENFDAEIGRKIARQNAVQKIWPLMGYELRSKMANQ